MFLDFKIWLSNIKVTRLKLFLYFAEILLSLVSNCPNFIGSVYQPCQNQLNGTLFVTEAAGRYVEPDLPRIYVFECLRSNFYIQKCFRNALASLTRGIVTVLFLDHSPLNAIGSFSLS